MDKYLTAAAIVLVVTIVSLIGGWHLLSKMSFTRQRQTLPTIVGMNNGLFALLSKYRKWRVVDMVDNKAVQKYPLYFNHGLNPSFYPTIEANKRGVAILKSHK